MANVYYQGSALKTYGVLDFVFAGTWEADDTVTITIGSKSLVTTTGSTVIATIIDTLVTAFNALSATLYPEFSKMTASRSSSTLRFTHDSLDTLFAVTVSTADSGGGADAQTIDGGASSTGTFSTASAGPNHWSTALNWSTGAIPANTNDAYIDNTDKDLIYGLSQSGVTLTSLNIPQNFTGDIGLPDWNPLGWYEYLTPTLAISATTVNLGYGPGSGSQRIRLNTGTNASTVNVFNTGQPAQVGVPAFCWKGVHASNALNAQKGSIGVAFFSGDTATLPALNVGFIDNQAADADVWCGSGTTLTTINQNGGKVTVNSAVTTLNITNGVFWAKGAAAITTITAKSINGSRPVIFHNSSGTITTLTLGHNCTFDASMDTRALTITNCTLRKGAVLNLANKTVTFSNPIALSGCLPSEVQVITNSAVSFTFTA